MRTLACSICLFASFAFAGDLSVNDLAKLKRDIARAKEAVAKKYGDKPTGEQRREMVKEQQEATQAVLDKAGVEQSDFVRATARASGNDVDAAVKDMDKAEAAKKKSAAKTDASGQSAGDQAADDQAAAAEMDKQMGLKGGKKK